MNALKIHSWTIGLLISIFVTTASPRAWAGAHDDAVYQRYSRKVSPGKVLYDFDMKFTELTRPGTQEEVDKGTAIFTFDGLGSSQVWKLPECPIFCEWPSLKDYPFEGQSGATRTNYQKFGYVCQAEDLQINGQWKRYFGFVCRQGTAVVPAEKIYLHFSSDCDPVPHINWLQLPGGIDWGMLGPDVKTVNGLAVPVNLKVGDPLPVEIYLRNRRGVVQKVLGDLFRDAKKGGPAFRKGIKLSLEWAPFNPRTADTNYPHADDFRPVSPICTNVFNTSETGPSLGTGEVVQGPVFDLRDWFDITLPGYYSYHFSFNPEELGLPTDEGGGGNVYVSFKVGSQPRWLTVEELNRNIPPFGDPKVEAKISALIQRSLKNLNTLPVGNPPVREQLPQFNHTPKPNEDGPPDESELVGLWIANRELLEKLKADDRGQLGKNLETLMEQEKAMPMKLFLASEATPRGSQRAAMFLLESLKDTDYEVALNTYAALRFALENYKDDAPDWLVQLVIAALSDDRYVTNLQKSGWNSPTIITMSRLAERIGELTYALGNSKCTNAVPFLIERARTTEGGQSQISALGNIGDPRAIPLLIDIVRHQGPMVSQKKDSNFSGTFLEATRALGNLHAKEAVLVLLEYIEYPQVIEALENIGDPRALAPLQKLVLSKGEIEKSGAENDSDLKPKRLVEARIAVASLDPDDRIAKLCKLLTDLSFDEYQRRSVVWRLGRRPDPRAIPFLAKAVKTDPSGAVVNQAVTVLAVFKYKAAVDELIGCFDADFVGKSDWKRAYKPEMFRENIADALRTLTGAHFGPDKAQWLTWWKEHRETTPGLK
ncbi:MAG: hypothetical protein JWR26_1138 [Pedosphaera sp.]|nr:hypothetical protein [Pedosphaera sp.]